MTLGLGLELHSIISTILIYRDRNIVICDLGTLNTINLIRLTFWLTWLHSSTFHSRFVT